MVHKNARVVQDGYEDSERVVMCALGATDGLQVGVGLQGSTLDPSCLQWSLTGRRSGRSLCGL